MQKNVMFRGLLCAWLSGWAVLAASAGEKVAILEPSASEHPILSQVSVSLEAGGDLQVTAGDQKKTLKMNLKANLRYAERRTPQPSAAAYSLRHYETATASIHIEQNKLQRQLRDTCRIVHWSQDENAVLAASLGTPLQRDELELIDIPGNSLVLPAVLPTEEVELQSTWKPADAVWGKLMGLDVVGSTTMECKLAKLEEKSAQVDFTGTIDGAIAGATTVIQLSGRCQVDRGTGLFRLAELLVEEKRGASLTGPAVHLKAKVRLEAAPLAKSATLDAIEIASSTGPTADPRLLFVPGGKQYELLHGRGWHMVNEQDGLAMFRLVERGELVAQCNLAVPPAQAEKTPMPLEQFQRDVEKVLGKSFQQFAQAATETHPAGYTMHRVVALGEASDLSIQWIYYYLHDPQGRHVVAAITLEKSVVDRFGTADRALVEGLKLTSSPQQSAQKPAAGPQRQ